MTNPLEIIRGREERMLARKAEVEALRRELLADDCLEILPKMPAIIAKRQYVDCTVMNWEGKEYAGFDARYYDDHNGCMFGLPLIMLHNDNQDPMWVLGARHWDGMFRGGEELTPEDLRAYINGVGASEAESSLIYFNALAKYADEKQPGPLKYLYVSEASQISMELDANRRSRMQAISPEPII